MCGILFLVQKSIQSSLLDCTVQYFSHWVTLKRKLPFSNASAAISLRIGQQSPFTTLVVLLACVLGWVSHCSCGLFVFSCRQNEWCVTFFHLFYIQKFPFLPVRFLEELYLQVFKRNLSSICIFLQKPEVFITFYQHTLILLFWWCVCFNNSGTFLNTADKYTSFTEVKLTMQHCYMKKSCSKNHMKL